MNKTKKRRSRSRASKLDRGQFNSGAIHVFQFPSFHISPQKYAQPIWEPLKIHISSQLMELLAIPLSRQKTATKWLVMLCCVKNFLLTYTPYAARRNSLRAAATRLACLPLFRALLTIPHGLPLPVADRRPPGGAFRRTLNF